MNAPFDPTRVPPPSPRVLPGAFRRDLARLLAALRALRAGPGRRILLEEAEIELWRVWRREQARLLCAAAALRGRRASRADLDRWRAGARDCVALCAADGYPVPAALARCAALPSDLWPSARALQRAAARHGA